MSQRKRIDQQKPLTWHDAPEMLTPPMAARVMGMHTNSIEKAMKAGKLAFTRVGRVRKITKATLAAYAGIDLAAVRGKQGPDPESELASYAARIETAMAGPGPDDAIEAIRDIVNEMKNEASYGSPDPD